ncbi:MAG: hypothetical protein ABL958_20665 [Bdellovibrionia bacterium]
MLRDLWYLGSKKGFEYLRKRDLEIFRLFEVVYREPMNVSALEKLAEKI